MVGNLVKCLIDGDEYFQALHEEVQKLKKPTGSNKFFYFTSWTLTLVNPDRTVYVGKRKGLHFNTWRREIIVDTFKLGKAEEVKKPDYPQFID